MVQGLFYFIKDEFYTIYDKENKLMRSDESIRIDCKKHGRPCFFAVYDWSNPLILWCVPISSQIEKYMRIYNHKITRQKERGIKNPKCNTIYFGEIMEEKSIFNTEYIYNY